MLVNFPLILTFYASCLWFLCPRARCRGFPTAVAPVRGSPPGAPHRSAGRPNSPAVQTL